MKNFIQQGDTVDLTPTIAVASGVGYLVGTALFGVAKADVAANTEGAFLLSGVVDIAKTSALAITAGDRLFWDATNKVVNKTAASQMCVGVAVADAANPSATVRMLLGSAPVSGA